MRTTLLVTVLVILHLVSCAGKKPHEKLTDKLKCMCDCDAATDPKMCDCKCQQPKTICAPGYLKVCPEMDGKCGKDTKAPLCPKDIFGLLESTGRALDNWVVVKEVEERKPELGAAVRSPRKKQRWTGVEVKCDKIPKFKCDFIVDYAPGEVTDFKAAKCTHRKNIKKCPITLETDDGCTIKAFLYNKQKDIFTKGRIAIECDWTTTAAPTTTPGATTTIPDASIFMAKSGTQVQPSPTASTGGRASGSVVVAPGVVVGAAVVVQSHSIAILPLVKISFCLL